MNQFNVLVKALAANTYGISALTGRNADGKARKKALGRALLFVALGVYLLAIAFIYFYGMSSVLNKLGMIDTMITLTATLAVGASLLASLLHTYSYVFNCRDYELLSAMPLRSSTIFLSKYLFLYAESLIYSLLAAAPSIVCYGIFAAPPVWFYPIMVVIVLFAPALGVAIGGIISYLFSFISLSPSLKNKLLLVFNVLLVLGIMYVSISFSTSQAVSGGDFTAAAGSLNSAAAINPLSPLVLSAAKGNMLSLLLYILINCAALAAVVAIAGTRFQKAAARMNEFARGRAYTGYREKGTLPPLAALFRREMSAYFSQYVYVMNTLIGFILMMIAAVVLLLNGGFADVLASAGINGTIMLPIAVLGFTFMAVLSPTTCSSISLEGQTFWIVRSLPVNGVTVLLSKLLVWFAISIPATVVSSAIACVALRIPVLDSALLIVYLLMCCVFTGLAGLLINLKSYRLNWTNAATVVKQSTAVLLSMLISFALCGIAAAAVFLLPVRLGLACLMVLLAAGIALLSLILYRRGDEMLRAIEL